MIWWVIALGIAVVGLCIADWQQRKINRLLMREMDSHLKMIRENRHRINTGYREMRGLLREMDREGNWDIANCPMCNPGSAPVPHGMHEPGCRLAKWTRDDA